MKYGYCRISRATQNIERQTRNIKEVYPDAVMVQEYLLEHRQTAPNGTNFIIKYVTVM